MISFIVKFYLFYILKQIDQIEFFDNFIRFYPATYKILTNNLYDFNNYLSNFITILYLISSTSFYNVLYKFLCRFKYNLWNII